MYNGRIHARIVQTTEMTSARNVYIGKNRIIFDQKMKAIFNSTIECLNWTKGKEYETKPSFVVGYVLILDDNGAEQLIRNGDSDFLWVK